MDDTPTPGSDMPADRSDIAPDSAQVAAVAAAPSSFASAAAAAGLEADLLAAELAQLMLVPVWLEQGSGEQAVLPPSSTEPSSDDPQLLLAMLTGLGLSDLMSVSVDSGIDMRQELAAATMTDDAAATLLQSLLSLSLSELMSVGALEDLVLTNHADLPRPDSGLDFDPMQPAGSLASDGPSPTDHVAPLPGAAPERFVPPPPPTLFTAGDDTIIFDTIAAGAFAGNVHDARSGDDSVALPSTPAEAAEAGYDPSDGFGGGAGNDTIIAGGLADAIDGGAGTDTVSYAGSGGVVVLLQNADSHGPHANEPAGGTGGLAQGDSYVGIETVVASEFADYVFGGDGGTTAYLLGGNDEYDNTETQVVSDHVDGGGGNDSIWGGDGADVLIGGDGGDRLSGERGADTLDGGTGADALNGQDGNDLLDGGAGLDSLSGGNGDDVLIWRGADAQFAGGAGTDTLRVAGGDLALGSLAGIASGIERIDIAADTAANGLTLAAADIVSLSDSDTLTIAGTAGDSVDAGTAGDSVDAGTGWTDGGIVAGNHVFTKLVGATLATLVINQDVTVNADITV